MQLKDYYQILGLAPSAGLADIKKAYRKLAQQYHPDKSSNDAASNLHFAEIKEAYEVLTNPAKKSNYLQQRWYQQSLGKKNFRKAFSAVDLLQESLTLERWVARLDAHRMDKQSLFKYVIGIIPDEVIEKLNAWGEETINKQVVQAILRSTHHLSYQQLSQIGKQVRKIKPIEFSERQIQLHLQRKKHSVYWERWRVWLVLLFVVLICLLILISS